MTTTESANASYLLALFPVYNNCPIAMVVLGLHVAEANFNDNISIRLCQSSSGEDQHENPVSLSQYGLSNT